MTVEYTGTWDERRADPSACGPAFGDLVEAMRRLQDTVTQVSAPDDAVQQAAEAIRRLTAHLDQWRVSEWERCAGRRHDLPGRGHPLLLPLTIDEQTPTSLRGRVVFTPYYLGGNGAAHGGTVPLLFDEVLGMLANVSEAPPPARTAYLTVNYRAITPIGAELRLEAIVGRRAGRKLWVTGTLHDGDRLVADAEGLFVKLRPGMP
jgi:acyl-coenzyme A thioesterase PaaI-like protein